MIFSSFQTPNLVSRRVSIVSFLFLASSFGSTAWSAEFQKVNNLAKLPTSLKITAEGKIDADSGKWKIEKDADGTDLLTLKSGDETKVAAMRTSSGELEAVISYTLRSKNEFANALLFKEGKLASFTTCETEDGKDSIGRICVTATAKLCQNLRKGAGLEEAVLKEVDVHEMRALAAVLTLRGSDHQLDNAAKTGNRLGLKTALQTTKGQLYTLAKQIAKETKTAGSATSASVTVDDEKANKLAKSVLEKSLPRLKSGCATF